MKKHLLASLLPLFLAGSLAANDFHPEVPLLDASGELLVNSGGALSTMQTCGACHDTTFMAPVTTPHSSSSPAITPQRAYLMRVK